jgi:uncharacterized protein DUF2154
MCQSFVFLAALCLLTTACVNYSDDSFAEPVTVTETVELGDAENVTAEIRMPAGELRVSGGTSSLMEGEFTYTSAALEPEISYEASSFRGRLEVRGRRDRSSTNMHGTNRWTLKLNDDVPLDIEIGLGAGESKLDLRGTTLRSLNMEIGAGEVDINLLGEWDRNFDVKVKGGVGELTIRVPANVGVIANAKGGIGDIDTTGFRKEGGRYVNDAYGDAPITITIDAKGGIGEINLISE